MHHFFKVQACYFKFSRSGDVTSTYSNAANISTVSCPRTNQTEFNVSSAQCTSNHWLSITVNCCIKNVTGDTGRKVFTTSLLNSITAVNTIHTLHKHTCKYHDKERHKFTIQTDATGLHKVIVQMKNMFFWHWNGLSDASMYHIPCILAYSAWK